MQLQRHVRLVISVTTLTVIASSPAELPRSLAQTGDVRSPGAQPITDTRERVRVTPAERDAILVEMRTMLQSLSGIMQGLIAGDVDMGQKSARASGMVTALDSSLGKNLPPDFRQLSMRTHKRFDGLAEAIKTGVARDAVLKQLAAVTASCVTCHDTYRLDETRE
jgi:hypothetical protein